MTVRRRRTPCSRKFTGPLAKPIRLKVHFSTLADAAPKEAQQLNLEERVKAFREWLSKFDLLFAHYGLENKNRDWPALVVEMAVDLVPGFQVVNAEKRGRGRPISPQLEDICLLVDAELVKQDLGADGSAASDTKAAAVLKNNPPYKARWGHLTTESLQNKISKARRSKNPLAVQWRWTGELRQLAREGLIEMFGATRQNIFVRGNKR
jgi:hypothetical protein